MTYTRKLVGLVLLLAAALPGWLANAGEAPAPEGKFYEMEVMGVAADPASGAPLVFLRTKSDRRELSMFIGPFEAQGILYPLEARRPPRPYTHDLMLEAIHRLKARLKRVVITALRENTYYAEVVLDAQGQEMVLDSRPSDAIALALREDVPILAAQQVIDAAARKASPEATR